MRARVGKKLELAVAVLNGTVGDYLARTGNGLATPMQLVVDGAPVAVEREALRRAYPGATARVVVLAHGLMCSESVWDLPGGGDYGALLSRDLGYTPLYLRYNSGLAIPDSGAALARLLESLLGAWPVAVEEILLLGFSMGGLVVRAACHQASVAAMRWLPLVRRAIYVGTPHLGAPYERIGRALTRLAAVVPDPFVRLAAQIGDLRSDGIKDLGDADLRHEDRERRRARVSLRDPEHPVPLLPGIAHYIVAGALSTDPRLATVFGDALVPMASGTNGLRADPGTLALPPPHVKVLAGTAHMTLAHDLHVYEQIRAWCEEPP
ncbi:MAG: esterase/lipase family protein [Polyangiaceae bacterium]